jgi:hypothetical protein
MKRWIALASMAAASAAQPALAGEEDAAHRADRLRTEALNRQAAAVARRRDSKIGADGAEDYRAAMDRYERRMAEWRRRVRACEAGDWSACD